MPHFGYSVTGLDPTKTAYASGRNLMVSPKAAREVCNAIKEMKLSAAMDFLKEVMEKRAPVPYKRYNKKMPHRRGLQGWAAGRYPVKAAELILKVLENADSNAMQKNLDAERLRIVHASTVRGMKMKKYIQRAFGRSSPRFEQMCHVEIIVGES